MGDEAVTPISDLFFEVVQSSALECPGDRSRSVQLNGRAKLRWTRRCRVPRSSTRLDHVYISSLRHVFKRGCEHVAQTQPKADVE